MRDVFLKEINLYNYRNFDKFQISLNRENAPVILIGKNGIGKTNILEAISFLFPTKGIRSVKFDEICRFNSDNWRAIFKIEGKLGPAIIDIIYNKINSRIIEFNGAKIHNNELLNIANIIWLTPQMDGIFLDTPSVRRKFFDKMIYNFDKKHAKRILQYDHYLSERAKILQRDNFVNDQKILSVFEQQISDISIEIAKARILLIEKLSYAMEKMSDFFSSAFSHKQNIDDFSDSFPRASTAIKGEIENMVQNAVDDLLIKDYVVTKLRESRKIDQITKKNNFGLHRSDFIVSFRDKNLEAKFCSNGQQKGLLLSLILANLMNIQEITNSKPILLLDEAFAYLDEKRREYLSNILLNMKLQSFITSTELESISLLSEYSQIINLGEI